MATIHTEKEYRFYLFSREEARMHVHISCEEGQAKYWLLPKVQMVRNHNLSEERIREVEELIEVHHGKFRDAWERQFGSQGN